MVKAVVVVVVVVVEVSDVVVGGRCVSSECYLGVDAVSAI